MPKPFADLCKVELPDSNPQGWIAGDETSKDSAQGILVELPPTPPYIGFYSYAFDRSLMALVDNEDLMAQFYRPLLNKRVWWSALKERGSVLKEGDKTYAFIKLTDIIAWDEPDVEAVNVYGRDSEIKL